MYCFLDTRHLQGRNLIAGVAMEGSKVTNPVGREVARPNGLSATVLQPPPMESLLSGQNWLQAGTTYKKPFSALPTERRGRGLCDVGGGLFARGTREMLAQPRGTGGSSWLAVQLPRWRF